MVSLAMALCAATTLLVATMAVLTLPRVNKTMREDAEIRAIALCGTASVVLFLGSALAAVGCAVMEAWDQARMAGTWIALNWMGVMAVANGWLISKTRRERDAWEAVLDVMRRSRTRRAASEDARVHVSYAGRLIPGVGIERADEAKIEAVLKEIVGAGNFSTSVKVTPLPASATLRAAVLAPGGDDPMNDAQTLARTRP